MSPSAALDHLSRGSEVLRVLCMVQRCLSPSSFSVTWSQPGLCPCSLGLRERLHTLSFFYFWNHSMQDSGYVCDVGKAPLVSGTF